MHHVCARKATLSGVAVLLLASVYACGSSPKFEGVACTEADGCPDNIGAPGDGSGDGDGYGTDTIANGSGGTTGVDPSGMGGSGAASSGSGTGAAPVTSGPHFSGSGAAFRPLTPGCGPETAGQCTGSCEQGTGTVPTTVVRPAATLCFSGEGDATPEDPAVVIEQVIERAGDTEYVHARVTFDPSFTDNTFGEGSCCGWPERRGHRFGDLTGSDHTELLLTNGAGATALSFKIDLVTADPSLTSGFGTLGVGGGDGSILSGDPAHVLAVATSLDRNLNGCNYVASPACAPSGDCTVDSPLTDDAYTPAAETPNWDYRQVYEIWIDTAAFGAEGFGQAFITYTHSSPAKTADDTLTVEPSPCPPTWDTPYCPPSVILEGGNCFGTPPEGSPPDGASGAGGGSSGGGDDPSCPPNEQVYITTEGASLCTPIPYTNNPDRTPCPTGYVLDLASEGQFCVPSA